MTVISDVRPRKLRMWDGKRRFSVPFLMTWCHQIDLRKCQLNMLKMCIFTPKCTILHLRMQICTYIFKNCPGWHSLTPYSERASTLFPPRRSSTVPLFQSFHGRCFLSYCRIMRWTWRGQMASKRSTQLNHRHSTMIGESADEYQHISGQNARSCRREQVASLPASN